MVTAHPTRQLPAETSPVVLVMAARREAGLDRKQQAINLASALSARKLLSTVESLRLKKL
jgi:hypothetical protein